MNTFKNHFVKICREIAKPNLKEFNRLKSLGKCSSLFKTRNMQTKITKKFKLTPLIEFKTRLKRI